MLASLLLVCKQVNTAYRTGLILPKPRLDAPQIKDMLADRKLNDLILGATRGTTAEARLKADGTSIVRRHWLLPGQVLNEVGRASPTRLLGHYRYKQVEEC